MSKQGSRVGKCLRFWFQVSGFRCEASYWLKPESDTFLYLFAPRRHSLHFGHLKLFRISDPSAILRTGLSFEFSLPFADHACPL
jgi:hypothetical protein